MKTMISAPPNEKIQIFKIQNLGEFQPLLSFSKSKRFRSHKFGRVIEVSKFLARRKPVSKGKARSRKGTHILQASYVIYY